SAPRARRGPKACAQAALAELEALMNAHRPELAAVVIEPLVQGAAGMVVSPPGFLAGVRKLCDAANCLLVCDEVATGFGRTGKMFACEHEGVSPDLLCVAKGITGGYLPLAATLATEEIFEGFLANYEDMKHLFHGHSYTANPLAAAAALASLDVFEKDRTLERLQPKIARMAEGLARFRAHPCVGDIRQQGFMAGVELVSNRETKENHPPEEKVTQRICREARRRGLIIRPLGPVLIFMPPLAISEDELDFLLETTYASLEAVLGPA
ncbi:MAG: aminotransferase class III-fold pyridoxal phosphate-dependent enzyme, partial [Candidatus Methylomirabilis sp.]|nr:aminotransferase class III-fold pyridoxal phosphate-dependent enzyme [Deltaproteobacteria bacterium]